MEDKKKQIKREILIASQKAGACHIGSALSCVDILYDLFYLDKLNPKDFIFGKASGVAAYYVILADLGYFNKDHTWKYLKSYPLPDEQVPGVWHTFGSVGHALSVAVGRAYVGKETHVLLSDGDCQEGATFEATLFAGHHNLTNLFVYVDNNRIQACGKTKDIMNMGTVWDYMTNTLPNVQIYETTKGDGVDFMEDNYEWHYKNLTEEQLNKALCQLI